MQRRGIRGALIATACVAMMGAAGCGDSKESESSGTTAATSQPAGEPIKLSVLYPETGPSALSSH